ncbi:MAG: hypothetical protein LUG61_00180 [Lachnospiraceae bacterium]|nr:hypothetical protein [Lachnospiraceae bacterium]
MSVTVYVLECIVMCTVFGVSIFGMMLVNPVSFIGDYPPEIQAQYYSSQHKEAEKEKMTFLTILRKVIAIIAFLFRFAWMAHMAGAETFADGLLLVYGYMIVLAAFDNLLSRLGAVCQHQTGAPAGDRAYGQRVSSEMVPCEGYAAHGACFCRGRDYHFPDDDVDLVNAQKKEE